MGYIKLFRTIQDWEWYDDPNTLALWVHLLVGANWKESEWHGEAIPRGSFITSVSKLASETGLSERQIRTCLGRLEKTGEIVREGTNKWTKITVCKYDSYQVQDDAPAPVQDAPKPVIKQIETPKPTAPKKEGGVVDKKPSSDAVSRLYALYPTKCPVSGRATGKSSKDKEKIARLLKVHTEQELSDTITRYVRESTEQQSYIKNFATFLNNLPDFSQQPQQGQSQAPERESYDEAIEKAKHPTKEEIKAWWDKRMAPFYPKNPGETGAQYRERILPSYESELKSWIENRVERVNQKYL